MNRIHKEMWELKDEFIDRSRAGEKLNIAEYCNRPYLTPEERKELREQLEEYEAAQTGLEKLATTRIWKRLAADFTAPSQAQIAAESDPDRDDDDVVPGKFGGIQIEVIDSKGKILETVEFMLEKELKVDEDGELVFSAIAPDDRFRGEEVSIWMNDTRSQHLYSATVDNNGRLSIFLDLSFRKDNVSIHRDMIIARLVRTKNT